jgi:hypothetical protein
MTPLHAGHVNNIMYLRYAESARLQYYRLLLDDQKHANLLSADGLGPILASVSIKFKVRRCMCYLHTYVMFIYLDALMSLIAMVIIVSIITVLLIFS